MQRIGILTSGGDAPGMNAAIRAVVRAGIHSGLKMVGIQHGYTGLIEGSFIPLEMHSVSNIIQRGGTMLKTARSEEFLTREGRVRAVENLQAHEIDAVVAIGGDGTFHGATALEDEFHFPMIGIPGTIDNDLYGTDFTIGFDTAVNTALDAVDKIRDTAEAFERTFYIEVMGRNSGFIASEVALSCGAEFVAIPETPVNFEALAANLGNLRTTKRSSIIVVAEGAHPGGAIEIARTMKERYGIDYRVCILGHIQRGGAPSAKDRIQAAILGAAAVEAAVNRQYFVMVGRIEGKVVQTPLRETWMNKKPVNLRYVKLIDMLAK